MGALTKADIADRLASKMDVGMDKKDAKAFVDLFFEVLRQSLEQGHTVKLSGFGNFMLRDKRERPGRNPMTGEEIPVKPRRVVTFKPGQKLRARVESYSASQEQPQA